MSRLDELIKELCPDGVEYKELSEIFNTRNGYTPSKTNPEYWENGTIPWFRMEDIRANGRILNDAIQKVSCSAVKGTLFPADSIIVATSATIGEHALLTVESLANQRFTYLMLKADYKKRFDIKFLFYYCFKLDKYCLNCLNQGNFASVDMIKFNRFPFPIPPLPVQQEIVRILDSFTELTAELTAELEARKKQYNYYKYQILFRQSITKRKLCDIAEFHYGQGNKIPEISGEYPVYGCKGIVGTTNRYNSENASIIGHIGSAGSITWGQGKHYVTYNGTICKGIENVCNSRYLYHILTCLHLEKRLKGNQPFLSISDYDFLEIPVPTIDEQNFVVKILDRFDSLCNDISNGLPAEIAVRQKQYEYYRDKLLTFKEYKPDA